VKAAILSTASPDAEIFAPQLLRVVQYADSATSSNLAAQWHTQQVWMSCDGSAAISHGQWQRSSATGWYVTVWRRQKGGAYKWVLEQTGSLAAPSPHSLTAESDMISASVADCPERHARPPAGNTGAPLSDRGKAPAADYLSGQADDATLAWTTTVAADGGRSFALRLKQDGVFREVLHVTAAPGA
jgi:hypothetical protein